MHWISINKTNYSIQRIAVYPEDRVVHSSYNRGLTLQLFALTYADYTTLTEKRKRLQLGFWRGLCLSLYLEESDIFFFVRDRGAGGDGGAPPAPLPLLCTVKNK